MKPMDDKDDIAVRNILQSSRDYLPVTREQAAKFLSHQSTSGWMDWDMPRRQYETVVKRELDQWRRGISIAPYQVLCDLLSMFPLDIDSTILDVGCSSGYYSKVLRVAGIIYHYTGLDFSPYFRDFALDTFGESVNIVTGDATNMPAFKDRSFDVVITGGMLMHILDYPAAIREIQRVADRQIVWHRTPVTLHGPTSYYIKEAYGLRCVEIHFNESEIVDLFEQDGWRMETSRTVSWDKEKEEGHVSYLFRRVVPE